MFVCLFANVQAGLVLAEIEPVGLAIGAVAGAVVGFVIGFFLIKNMGSSALKRGHTDAAEITAKAKSEASEIVKKAELNGKAEYLKIKETAEKEVDSMRKEMREGEQRLQKR